MDYGELLNEYVILVYDPGTENFTIQKTSFMDIALAGAILLELILQGRLAVNKEYLVVVDETPVDDQIMNSSFELMKQELDTHSSLFWMREIIAHNGDLSNQVIDRLIEQNIFERKVGRYLFFFKSTKYKLLKKNLQKDLKQRLCESIMSTKEIDPRDVAIFSLLYATNSATNVIPSDKVDQYMDKIRGMVEGELIGQSISQSIHDIIDALMRSYIINFYSY